MVRPERRRALRAALEDLAAYRRRYDRPTFLASRDAQRQVLHAMYVAVQGCVDEAQEICATRSLETDGSYRDAFLALGRAGLLPAQHAGQLADWASMRNVLAHFYPVLDLERVYAALDERGPLEAFEDWLLEKTQPREETQPK